ncbi:MAG: glycyl-radical enzyme activating protein [Fimbriimonadaceae bacterium]|nr:glycyl-radical enzyme activating protein [Fimbriimonadaceae bacterium]
MPEARLLVMDVLRAGLNDGPGVRTTVFTKGCPLKCRWCHNPESQRPLPELSFDAERCAFCGRCEETCDQGVHRVEAGTHRLERRLCLACGRCASDCPTDALKLVGRWWRPEEIVSLALRDRRYYERSGGGLTISGGEPMAQFEALRETLRLAKREGLHTCLDTCGHAPLADYLDVAPWVDLFLWDVKATGEAHARLTGVDDKRIERNLRALYASGARIRLRCPLVPGLNDSDAHLARLADLARTMPELDGLDIMPFHALGRDKAARVGMTQQGLPTESAGPADISGWLATLADLGCRDATVG